MMGGKEFAQIVKCMSGSVFKADSEKKRERKKENLIKGLDNVTSSGSSCSLSCVSSGLN